MTRTRTMYLKVLRSIVIVLGVFFLFETSYTAHAAPIDEKISDTKNTVQKLLEVKDDATLPAPEKERLALQLKKNIVTNVLDISTAQLKDARSALQQISFPESTDWKEVQTFIFSSLDTYDTFYKEARITLQKTDMTTDDVEKLAKEIEVKRENDIDIFLRKTTSIRTAFGISDILKRADERMKKVENDVQKIYSQKITQKDDLNILLQKATTNIKDGHALNNRAKEIILNLYIQTATGTATQTEFSTAFEKEVDAFIKEHSTQTEKKSEEKTTNELDVVRIYNIQKEEYLQDIIKRSAEKVREAYNIFIQMSLTVKEYTQE